MLMHNDDDDTDLEHEVLDASVTPDTEGHAFRELHGTGVQRPHVQNLITGSVKTESLLWKTVRLES